MLKALGILLLEIALFLFLYSLFSLFPFTSYQTGLVIPPLKITLVLELGDACKYPGCVVKQQPMQIQIIDVHHIGTRKRRPDLITVVTNRICLCNFRTTSNHHGWVHSHPIEAVEMKLLSDRSYELATKEGTLGNY